MSIFEVVLISIVVFIVGYFVGMSTGVSIKLIEPKVKGAITLKRNG